MSYQALLKFKHKKRLPFLQIKVISLTDLNPLVIQKLCVIKLITKTSKGEF